MSALNSNARCGTTKLQQPVYANLFFYTYFVPHAHRSIQFGQPFQSTISFIYINRINHLLNDDHHNKISLIQCRWHQKWASLKYRFVVFCLDFQWWIASFCVCKCSFSVWFRFRGYLLWESVWLVCLIHHTNSKQIVIKNNKKENSFYLVCWIARSLEIACEKKFYHSKKKKHIWNYKWYKPGFKLVKKPSIKRKP